MNKNKAVWITGASSGIGKALAIKFLKNKHNVIGSARSSLTEKTEGEFNNFNESFKYIPNDVSNLEKVHELYENIKSDYKIDCLINNAGITSFKPFLENTVEEIESIIDTNLKGSIYTIKTVLPDMLNSKSGIIINILSVAAKKIFTNSSLYAASKSALEAFSKVLREEVREHNIKIVNIYPGATLTEIWPEDASENFSSRMMKPESLADFIFDIYTNASEISPEEIVVRPILGDL